MGYSRNFGFRSFENIVRGARNAIPRDSEDLWVIGTALKVDADAQGYVSKPDKAEAPHPGCGILVYEFIQYKGDDPYLINPADKDEVPLGEYVQVVRGNGVKVWLKNTEDRPLYDGRPVAGRNMIVDATTGDPLADFAATVTVGAYLTPNASGFWEVGSSANGWLWVEQVDADTQLVEARLTF